jgi:phosphoenolpyruvate-protein kinase (PTS system EI component)
MAERVLRGASASPGVGLGAAWARAEEIAGGTLVPGDRQRDRMLVPRHDRARERDAALAALAASAEALAAVAAGLPPEEAEIVETGALMARDPALAGAVEEAVLADGLTAGLALIRATGAQADAIAAIDDETLAARADDVRSLGRRAARLTTRGTPDPPPGTDLILIARDLGPADVAELAASLAGIALAAGSTTSHAAIVSRSLGVPMVTGLGPRILELAGGTVLAVDGTEGTLTIDPSQARARVTASAMQARRRADERAHAERDQPAATRDGKRVTVLANVASAAELRIALRAGAEGIGLLRTELAFLDAGDWPDEQGHTDALAPIVAALEDHQAVVRVLDFGADKSPPFLRGTRERGLELLLGQGDAFIGQLRAILLCARDHDLRILLPMVDGADQVTASRALLERAARELGVGTPPPLGSMIETERGAEDAGAIAAHSDFLSIGTNDLTAAMLGVDRFTANSARAHHPHVLRAIARAVAAAHGAGQKIEVCGEAASDALVLPLLVGLGVDEVSVGAARVGTVRTWIRRLRAEDAERLARSALAMDSAGDVEIAIRPLAGELLSAQSGNGSGERVERGTGVRALGA